MQQSISNTAIPSLQQQTQGPSSPGPHFHRAVRAKLVLSCRVLGADWDRCQHSLRKPVGLRKHCCNQACWQSHAWKAPRAFANLKLPRWATAARSMTSTNQAAPLVQHPREETFSKARSLLPLAPSPAGLGAAQNPAAALGWHPACPGTLRPLECC